MKLRATRRSHKVVLDLEMGPGDSALPPAGLTALQLKRILAPVDFSECSHKALHYAMQFARQFNAELMLLHVLVTVPPPPEMVVFDLDRLEAQYREEAAKRLSEWRKQVAGMARVKAVIRDGTSAHQEIVEAARQSNSDLIVIGNHGRTGLVRLWMGSTAEAVVRHAPCPVMVIREREHEFLADEGHTGALAQA